MTATDSTAGPRAYLQRLSRWHPIEIAFWLATLTPFLLFPDYLSLAGQICVTALFALSLDLILGYAGIVSLGHAAFFGVGAYTAGLFSKFVWGEPFTGLVVAAAMAALFGYASSFIVARFRHLTLIMITLGLGLLLHEAANSAGWLTGGIGRPAGHRHLAGARPVQVRSLRQDRLWLFAGRAVCGFSDGAASDQLTLWSRAARHPRELVRMPAIGAASRAHIRKIYTIAAAMAGVAGAVIGADDVNRVAGSAEFRALGRRAGHAGAGRRRQALRGANRRHRLPGGARPVFRHRAAILVFLDRPSADNGRDAAAERHSRRPVRSLCAMETANEHASLLSTRGVSRASARWWSPAISSLRCRSAPATR